MARERGLSSAAPANRSFEGTSNNLRHPRWEAAGSRLLRWAIIAYDDGNSVPAGAGRPLTNKLIHTRSSTFIKR